MTHAVTTAWRALCAIFRLFLNRKHLVAVYDATGAIYARRGPLAVRRRGGVR